MYRVPITASLPLGRSREFDAPNGQVQVNLKRSESSERTTAMIVSCVEFAWVRTTRSAVASRLTGEALVARAKKVRGCTNYVRAMVIAR